MYLYYRHDNVGKIIYEEITADEQGKVTSNVVSHQLSLTVMEKKYGGMYL